MPEPIWTDFQQQIVQTELEHLYRSGTRLSPRFAPTAAIAPQIYAYSTLESTNLFLADLMQQGAAKGTVVIAQQQQSGRGQRGRVWQSEAGGIYLSVALRPDCSAQAAQQLTLCCSWGIAQALRQGSIPVQIKWPNDLVIEGRKLAGILTETRLRQGQVQQAVVGVGLNWGNSIPAHGIALRDWMIDQGRSPLPSMEQVVAQVLWGLLSAYSLWQQVGMAAIAPDYHELLSHLGQWVPLGDRQVQVIGISLQGDLEVREAETESDRHLQPGEIHLGYATPGEPNSNALSAGKGGEINRG